MEREYCPNTVYQKFITTLQMSNFDFVIDYAEILNGSTIEFLHHHPHYEIYYVMEGSLKIFAHDRDIIVGTNELLFLAPNACHHVFYEPNQKRQYFVFIFDFLLKSDSHFPMANMESQEIKTMLDKICDNNYLIAREPFEGKQILQQLRCEMDTHKIGWNSCVSLLFYQFFLQALRHIDKETSQIDDHEGILNMALEASKYIHMNYAEPIGIESVAQYLHITPRHVNRVFQSLFGTTFGRTLSTLRVEYAKNYLCNTNYTVEKIAELVGFSSAQSLYKLFKKQEGISISEYHAKYANFVINQPK